MTPARDAVLDEIRRRAWRRGPLPGHRVTTMLSRAELRLLRYLARHYFADEGAIVDGGCFLGGSTVALADGLRAREAMPGRKIQSYDLFAAEGWTIGSLLPAGMRPGESFQGAFERAIEPYRDLVEAHAGDIVAMEWPGWPIELLFIDLAKTVIVNDFIVRTLFPRLIPGVSLVIHQDYLYWDWNAWIHITMERLSPYFEVVTDTGINSVVFRLVRAIPEPELEAATVGPMAAEDKLALLDRARRRWRGAKAAQLHHARGSYLCGPLWCTGPDPAGHAAVLRRLALEDLAAVRGRAGSRLSARTDHLSARLEAARDDLAALQALVSGPVMALIERRRGLNLVGPPFSRLQQLLRPIRWWIGIRRLRLKQWLGWVA